MARNSLIPLNSFWEENRNLLSQIILLHCLHRDHGAYITVENKNTLMFKTRTIHQHTEKALSWDYVLYTIKKEFPEFLRENIFLWNSTKWHHKSGVFNKINLFFFLYENHRENFKLKPFHFTKELRVKNYPRNVVNYKIQVCLSFLLAMKVTRP